MSGFDEKWLQNYVARGGRVLSDNGRRAAEEPKSGVSAQEAGEALAKAFANVGISCEDIPDAMRMSGMDVPEAMEKPKRSKYGNRKTELDGMEFDSRHEAKVYEELRLSGRAGEFNGLARQVVFFLPGGVKYVADFVKLNRDGTYTVIDAKSEATRKNAVYRLKKRQMRECLGLEIIEV